MKKTSAVIALTFILSMQLFSDTRLADSHYKRAVYLYKKSNYSGCAIQLLNVIRDRSTYRRLELLAKSQLLLGKCYNNLGDYNSAEFYLYQVFKNTPVNRFYKEALLEIAKTFTLAKNYKKAFEVYRYIEQHFIESNYLSEAIYQKGELSLLIQNQPKAIDYYRQIILHYRNTHRFNDALNRLRQLGYVRENSSVIPQQQERIYRPEPRNQIPIERIPDPVGLTPEQRQAIEAAHAQGQQTINQAQQTAVQRPETQQQTTQVQRPETQQQTTQVQRPETQQQTTQVQRPETQQQTTQVQRPETQQQTTQVQRPETQQQTTQVQRPETQQQTTQVQRPEIQQQRVPEEPVQETPPPRMPDISFPSSRSYYPAEQSFSDRLRTDFLRGITNLSERDIQKLEARLRLLEERERELSRIRKEIQAFYYLLLTKDKILTLKAEALETLKKQLALKEQQLKQMMSTQNETQRRQGAAPAARQAASAANGTPRQTGGS